MKLDELEPALLAGATVVVEEEGEVRSIVFTPTYPDIFVVDQPGASYVQVPPTLQPRTADGTLDVARRIREIVQTGGRRMDSKLSDLMVQQLIELFNLHVDETGRGLNAQSVLVVSDEYVDAFARGNGPWLDVVSGEPMSAAYPDSLGPVHVQNFKVRGR